MSSETTKKKILNSTLHFQQMMPEPGTDILLESKPNQIDRLQNFRHSKYLRKGNVVISTNLCTVRDTVDDETIKNYFFQSEQFNHFSIEKSRSDGIICDIKCTDHDEQRDTNDKCAGRPTSAPPQFNCKNVNGQSLTVECKKKCFESDDCERTFIADSRKSENCDSIRETTLTEFKVTSWHPHVYANPPKIPTPHSIGDILGLKLPTKSISMHLTYIDQLSTKETINQILNATIKSPDTCDEHTFLHEGIPRKCSDYLVRSTSLSECSEDDLLSNDQPLNLSISRRRSSPNSLYSSRCIKGKYSALHLSGHP